MVGGSKAMQPVKSPVPQISRGSVPEQVAEDSSGNIGESNCYYYVSEKN